MRSSGEWWQKRFTKHYDVEKAGNRVEGGMKLWTLVLKHDSGYALIRVLSITKLVNMARRTIGSNTIRNGGEIDEQR